VTIVLKVVKASGNTFGSRATLKIAFSSCLVNNWVIYSGLKISDPVVPNVGQR